ncbi:MAG: hypothetical protein ABI288_02990 [Ginsengibacter sp.]
MATIKLDEEMNIEVKVQLISKGSDTPLSGNEFSVRLYDKDLFNDDFLGETTVKEGIATFNLNREDFSGPLNLDDKPDFYFVVYKGGREIFKSKVMDDIVLSDLEKFIMKEGKVIDLGTFLIDTKGNDSGQ